MSCEQIAPLLSASLDGAITGEEEHRLLDHVQSCDACRARLQRLCVARDAFRKLAPDNHPGRRPRTPFLPPAATAAALGAAAVMVLLLVLFFRPATSPPSPSVANDLVFMEISLPSTGEPCFYASDCGIDTDPRMP